MRAQWSAVRPELDTSPMGVVARVGRLAAYFDDSINELMRGYGLARSSWDVLASLRRVGEPYELSPTELYHGLMRTSGAMTNRLRRLEDSGLVERVPDPRDGRGLLVRLTATGLELVDRIAQAHMANEARLLAELEPSSSHSSSCSCVACWCPLRAVTPDRPPTCRRARHDGAPGRSSCSAQSAGAEADEAGERRLTRAKIGLSHGQRHRRASGRR